MLVASSCYLWEYFNHGLPYVWWKLQLVGISCRCHDHLELVQGRVLSHHVSNSGFRQSPAKLVAGVLEEEHRHSLHSSVSASILATFCVGEKHRVCEVIGAVISHSLQICNHHLAFGMDPTPMHEGRHQLTVWWNVAIVVAPFGELSWNVVFNKDIFVQFGPTSTFCNTLYCHISEFYWSCTCLYFIELTGQFLGFVIQFHCHIPVCGFPCKVIFVLFNHTGFSPHWRWSSVGSLVGPSKATFSKMCWTKSSRHFQWIFVVSATYESAIYTMQSQFPLWSSIFCTGLSQEKHQLF